jgi:hypothetical protein
MSPRRSRSSAVGEVFTLYFSQRIASTELDRTREPIPVRLLTLRRSWQSPLIDAMLSAGDQGAALTLGDLRAVRLVALANLF